MLQGTDRSIVSDVAGTTRDTVDALVVRGDMNYRIIDTAGIRKKGKVEYGAEFFMINRAFKASRRRTTTSALFTALKARLIIKNSAPYSTLPFLRIFLFLVIW